MTEVVNYYEYWEQYYEEYYDYYYEYIYWPKYYGVFNISNSSWCDGYTYNNISNTTDTVFNQTDDISQLYNVTLNNKSWCIWPHHGTFPPSPYEYPWKSKYDLDLINPIILTVSAICIAFAFLIFGLFVYQTVKVFRYNPKQRPDTLTIVLVTLCMIFHIIYCILDIISYYTYFVDYNYQSGIYINSATAWEIFWSLSKISLYSVFAYRYLMIAQKAVYKGNKNRKFIDYFCIVSAMIIQMILCTLFIIVYFRSLENEAHHHKLFKVYILLCWFILVIDCILVALLGYFIMQVIIKLIVQIEYAEMMAETAQISQNDDDTRSGSASRQSSQSPDQTQVVRVVSTPNSKPKRKKRKHSDKQMNLIYATTRIAVTCSISLTSSFVTQMIYSIAQQSGNDDLYWLTYTWSIDAVINMLCIYFSMAYAKDDYKKCCHDICKFHQCFMCCIIRIVEHRTHKKVSKRLKGVSEDLPKLVSDLKTCSTPVSPTSTNTVKAPDMEIVYDSTDVNSRQESIGTTSIEVP